MVDTLRVKRRQLVGESFREHGELIPEAHTWPTMEHWLHTGEIEQTEVSEDEFRAAAEKFCPALADQVYLLTGLTEGVAMEHGGTFGTPRAASLMPSTVHEGMSPETVKPTVRRTRALKPHNAPKTSGVTIRATDPAPGTARRSAPKKGKS